MAEAAAGTAIVGGRVVPVEGEPVEGGTVLLRDGKIAAVEGPGFEVPPGVTVIDAAGKWVLPGFVDAHVHLGVSEEAEGWAGQDTNERTNPNTAHVRALDAINPAEQGFRDAIGGGVLAVNVNPGSANPIGGQTAAIKCWGRTVDAMVLRAPAGLKSALGENPKRTYGQRNETPSTRLGTAAVIRGAFVAAQNYQAKLTNAAAQDPAERPWSTATSNSRRSAWSCGGRSRGGSTATGPTTSRPRCGWPGSSAMTWSSTTAPRPTCWPIRSPPRRSR